jgi:ferric-dicitrate binding protein FerR (iron transport regulator)
MIVGAAVLASRLSNRLLEQSRVYATASGQSAIITLDDSTRIMLAPRTKLRLTQFGLSSRTVALDGQAYFEVTHAAGAPFVVRTGSIATQVLGTSFLVRHYADDEQVHIAVVEGKVRVGPHATNSGAMPKPLTLTAGYAGDITDSTVVVNTVDLTPETDWLRGRLVFRHASVVQVLQTLSRWYGYQFRCSDSALTRERVTLALNAQSSAEALSTLEQILSVHLTIVGDTVTLTPHAGGASKGPQRRQGYDVWIPTREVGR